MPVPPFIGLRSFCLALPILLAAALPPGPVTATGKRGSDTRRFGINLRHNFGIRKKEQMDMFRMDVPGMGNGG